MPSCPICDKAYQRDSAYQKHFKLCKITPHKSSQDEAIPSYSNSEKCYLIHYLMLENSALKKRVELLEIILNTKKKKVGVFEWLNTNIKPTLNYADWVKTIQVKKSQFEYLFDNSIVETVYHIVSHAISENSVIPFYAFGKTQTFYVYTSDTWLVAEVPSFTKLFKRVETELWKCLTEWKKKNEVEIVENQMMTEKYQKTVAKLTDISYTPNDVYNKMKTKIYNSIKMDIKSIVEEEIEFNF
jgi:hypothetical protein